MTVFFELLKWLWPFLKESVFNDKTFRAWLKHNWRVFIWILLWLALAVSNLWLLNLLHEISEDRLAKIKQIDELKNAHHDENTTATTSDLIVKSLKDELAWSRTWMVNHRTPVSTPPSPDEPVTPKRKPDHRRNDDLIKAIDDWELKNGKEDATKGLPLSPTRPHRP